MYCPWQVTKHEVVLETENLSYIQSQWFVNTLRSQAVKNICMEKLKLSLYVRYKQWPFPALFCRSMKY